MKTPKEGDLKFWWIPQVPMKPFEVLVDSVRDAALLYSTLAEYDKFQFENKIKPDYSNVGGLAIFENGEWCDWENLDGEDIATLIRRLGIDDVMISYKDEEHE